MVYFGGFLAKLEFSRGFLYVCIFYIAGRISAAVMTGDTIFISPRWSSGRLDWGPYCDFSRDFFLILFSRRKNKAAMGGGGGEGIVFFRVPISLQGCDGWGERRGILYTRIKASVVQWKDIRPWQPRSSFRARCSSVGCNIAQKGTVYPESAA